jgi:hypothetical protein
VGYSAPLHLGPVAAIALGIAVGLLTREAER